MALFRVLALAAGAGVLSLYVFAWVSTLRFGRQSREPGWTWVRRDGVWRVQTVAAGGPAEGKLAPGDRIEAIDGDSRFAEVDPELRVRHYPAGRGYSVRVARGDHAYEVRFAFPDAASRVDAWWALSLSVAGLAFYGIGMIMGVGRPGERLTTLGCVISLVTSIHFAALILRPVMGALTGGERLVYAAAASAAPWHVGLAYPFFARFPSSIASSRPWSWLGSVVVGYCAVLSVPRVILNFVAAAGLETAIQFHQSNAYWIGQYQEGLFALESGFKLIAPAATCAVLLRNYVLLRGQPDQRRRLKWVAFGAALAIALPAVFTAAMLVTGIPAFGRTGAYPANIIVTNLVSTIIPITLGYAVIRHRVMGIDVALRRGIQYLLARGTLRVFLMLPFVAIVANVAAHPERTIQDVVAQSPLYGYGSAILAATLSLKFRQPLTAWVDRRFFREAYDREGMLFELIEKIKASESLPEISTATGDQLNAAIHPRNLHILCRQGETERFFPVYSSIGCSLEIRLSGDDRLVERPARAFQSSVVSVALERRGPFMWDA